mgnify:CR=1 FL=1
MGGISLGHSQKAQHYLAGQLSRASQPGGAGRVALEDGAKRVLVGYVEHAQRHHDLVQLHHIDAGAEDIQMEEDLFVVTTTMDDFAKVRDTLLDSGYVFNTADLYYLPQNEIEVQDPESQKNLRKMIDMLEDNDDVQSVFHNWQEPDEE